MSSCATCPCSPWLRRGSTAALAMGNLQPQSLPGTWHRHRLAHRPCQRLHWAGGGTGGQWGSPWGLRGTQAVQTRDPPLTHSDQHVPGWVAGVRACVSGTGTKQRLWVRRVWERCVRETLLAQWPWYGVACPPTSTHVREAGARWEGWVGASRARAGVCRGLHREGTSTAALLFPPSSTKGP